MLTIGDFSKLSRVSIKTLRFYDEVGLFKPLEVDRFTGYRRYSVSQLPELNRITGPNREIYLYCTTPVRQDDESYVTEIQFPVEKV